MSPRKINGRRGGVCVIKPIHSTVEFLQNVGQRPIYAQMQKLEVIKEESRWEMEQMGRSGVCSDLPAGLKDYRDYLAALRSLLVLSDTPELRARLNYFVGKSVIVPVDWNPGADKAHVGPGAVSAPSPPIRMVGGSNSLTFGAGDEGRTRDIQLGNVGTSKVDQLIRPPA